MGAAPPGAKVGLESDHEILNLPEGIMPGTGLAEVVLLACFRLHLDDGFTHARVEDGIGHRNGPRRGGGETGRAAGERPE